ncbi:MAG: hypothetical protein IPO86_08495 [Saprospiraceae bacterium]|nr:hypothetical protein [Saprospiraceae bacterium]MBK9728139.1 hypothetical protein [Saprospiraceae bacterium]
MNKNTESYKRLLISKEYTAFQGKRKINQWILTTIIVISIGCIALALDIYKSLQKRMNNPFTNWVDLPVLYEFRDSIKTMEEQILSDGNKSLFNLQSIIEYNQKLQAIFEKDLEKQRHLFIRSMQYDEELFKKITEPSNLAYFNNLEAFSTNKCDVFISEEIFKMLDLKWITGKEMKIGFSFRDKLLILNVQAVLKDIPNQANLICSSEMMNLLTKPVEESRFYRNSELSEITFLLKNEIKEFNPGIISGNKLETYDKGIIKLYGDHDYYTIKLFYRDYLNEKSIDSIKSNLNKQSNAQVLDLVEWECVASNKYFDRPQYLAFNFQKLNKIRSFKEYLQNKYLINLDISEVEDKENFALVSKLASSAIISIVVIGMLCFIIFLYFLISSHIDKIKQNIGTFMAFGLSNKDILRSYVYILMKLLLVSVVYGLALLFLIEFASRLTNGESLLDLLNPFIYLVISIFLVTGYIIVYFLVKRMSQYTPGDLIYNRV